MFRKLRVIVFILAAIAVVYGVVIVGCSKEDLSDALDKAKSAVEDGASKVQEQVSSTAEKVQEKVNLAGSFDLTAGDPLKSEACYVRILPQGEGRPAILQLQSYRDAERETFPSVFLQAHVQANSLAELAGEPLAGRMFVQRNPEGPVLFSDDAKPIEFKITAVAEKTVSFEITNAMLQDTSTGAEIAVTGTMTGVLD